MDQSASVETPEEYGVVSYAFKPSMMGGGHAFVLGREGIMWEIGRQSGQFPYRAVRRIRLAFRPASLATYRFTAEIWADNAPKLTVASTSWRSVVEHQRHDGEYAAFVRTLIHRVGRAGGATRYDSGVNPLLYWPALAVCGALAVVLPWIGIRAVQAGAMGAAAMIAGLAVLFGWQIASFFRRNRPAVFRPDTIPSAILPG